MIEHVYKQEYRSHEFKKYIKKRGSTFLVQDLSVRTMVEPGGVIIDKELVVSTTGVQFVTVIMKIDKNKNIVVLGTFGDDISPENIISLNTTRVRREIITECGVCVDIYASSYPTVSELAHIEKLYKNLENVNLYKK